MSTAAVLLFIAWIIYLFLSKTKTHHACILGLIAAGFGWVIASHQPQNQAPTPSPEPTTTEIVPAKKPALTTEVTSAPTPKSKPKEEKEKPKDLSSPVYEDTKFNARLTLPASQWKIYKTPSPIYQDAKFVAKNIRDRYTFIFIPEDCGENFHNLDIYAEAVKINLTRASMKESPRVVDTLQINNRTMKVIYCDSSVFFRTQKLISYTTIHQGYVYQLNFIINKNLPIKKLIALTKPVVECFTLIDPKLWSPKTPAPAKPEKFPSHGFAFNLNHHGWSKQEKPSTHGAVATWNMGRSSDASIFALELGSWDPSLEILKHAMISGFLDQQASSDDATTKPINIGTLQGIEQIEPATNPKLVVVTRIFREGSRAWMIRGSTQNDPSSIKGLTTIFDAFSPLPAGDKSIPIDNKTLANIKNQGGLAYFRLDQFPAALECFKAAAELDTEDEFYFGNTISAYIELDRPHDAIQAAKARPLPKNSQVLLELAHAYILSDDLKNGMPLLDKIIASKYRDDETFMQCAHDLHANKHFAETADMLTRYLKEGGSIEVQLWQTYSLIHSKRADQAIPILKKLAKISPQNQEVHEQWIEALLILDQRNDALSVINNAITVFPKSSEFLRSLGNFYADDHEYSKAVTAMEKAAALAPRNEVIQNDLAYLRARLGRGHDRDVRKPLEIVPLPENLPSEKIDMADIPLGDSHTRLYAIMHAITPGKPHRRTHHREVVIHTPAAIADYNTLRYSYSPLSEKIFINSCIVLDKNGKIIAKANPESAYVTDVDDSATNSDKYLCIPIPGLTVGCTIRSAVTISDRSVRDHFEFNRSFLRSSNACEKYLVGIYGDIDQIASYATDEISKQVGKNWQIWQRSAQPAYANEPLSADLETSISTLYLGAKGTSWASLTAEYLKDIEHSLALDNDISSLAKEIAGANGNSRQKALRLFRWIQANLTYKAIEFGTRARIPNPAPTTCQNRYGDCKDFSILLLQMLRANGIKAYPCLANTDYNICADIPSLDQFNHMILYLPAQHGLPECWLDPTESLMTDPFTPRPWLKGKHTLVCDTSRKSPLVSVPVQYSKNEFNIDIHRKLSHTSPISTSSIIDETITLNGSAADYLRDYIRSIPALQRTQKLREYISHHDSNFRLESLEVLHLDQQDQPFILNLNGTIDNTFSPKSGKIIRWPHHWENSYLDVTPYPSRVTPFAITHPWKLQVTTTAPRTCSPKNTPADIINHSPYGDLSITQSTGDNQLKRVFHARMHHSAPAKPCPASEYPAFVQFWKNALKAAKN